MSFQRISKVKAKAAFAKGEVVHLCPRKMRPASPFNPAVGIHSKDWQSWDQMMRHWTHYNASHETGYYPHYYMAV